MDGSSDLLALTFLIGIVLLVGGTLGALIKGA
jgi:hypothetical protein